MLSGTTYGIPQTFTMVGTTRRTQQFFIPGYCLGLLYIPTLRGGAPRRARRSRTQTLINYLPNKVDAGCALDARGSYSFWLIAPRARWQGDPLRCEGYACQNLTTDPEELAWQLGGRPSILPGACTPEDGNVGKGSARNRPQVSRSRIPQEGPAVNRLRTGELSTGPLAAVGQEGVAQEDHHRVCFLSALPQASRRRGMTSCRCSRASSPWEVYRHQNRRPLVSSVSVAPYARNRAIPWFRSGDPGPPTARYRTAASRGP